MPPKAKAKGVAAQAKAEAAAAGKDADFCDEEIALAVPGELIKAVAQDASGAARGRCWPASLQPDYPRHGPASGHVGRPLTARAKAAVAKARACAAVAGMRALSLSSSLGNSESEPRLQPQSELGQHLRQNVPARRDGAAKGHLGCPAGGRVGRQRARADSEPSASRVALLKAESLDEGQTGRQAEGQEQQEGKPADCERQQQGQGHGPTAAASSRTWHQWRMKPQSCSTGIMELVRFGACLQAAVTTAPGKTSEMLDLLK